MIRYAKYGAISYGLNSAICCVKLFAIGWCGSVETVNKVWYSYVPYRIVITEPYRSVLKRTVSYRIVPYLSYSFVLYHALLTIPYRTVLAVTYRTVLAVTYRT